MKIEFFRHNIGSQEKKLLASCLDGIFLTTGSYVAEFEKQLAAYLKLPYAVGLTSCTAALHLSLLALGIKEGDEVITTPMTFIATANAILYTGAKPIFVDVEPQTGLINADLIERAITPKTKGIIPVHLYGQMADMKKIRSIADKHHLKIIEDAAHCIEGQRDSVLPGQLGDIVCFSFYATKNITCGEGGAIATRDGKLAEIIRALRTHGMTKEASTRYTQKYQHWDMTMLGWKYNMSNIQAALLIPQLKRIDMLWKRREAICQRYEKGFKGNSNVGTLKVSPGSKSARHLFPILVPNDKRDEILGGLEDKGIGVAVNYRAIHLLSYYQKMFQFKKGMFPVAEDLGDRLISLPLYPKLTEREVGYVIKAVNELTSSP